MVKAKREKERYIEERLVKIGKAIRAKENDALGIIETDNFLDSSDRSIYRNVLLRSSSKEIEFVKVRYWEDETISNEEVAKKIKVNEEGFVKVRRVVLDRLLYLLFG